MSQAAASWAGVCRPMRAGFQEGGCGVGADVVEGKGVAGGEDVCCHAGAHCAEADEADVHGGCPFVVG